MEYSKYKVCVRCLTFNQAKFIEETMNGFVIQQTNFPFVCCIIDDASTDGEQNVIKKYMKANFAMSDSSIAFEKETDYAHILFAQHNDNKSCYFAILLLKNNLYSKGEGYKKFHYISEWRDNSVYEALCEGDDYWICANKLQKQADFLDSHPDYGLVHTDFDLVKGKRNHKVIIHYDGNYWPYSLTEGLNIGTLTTMIRLSVFKVTPRLYLDQKWLMGDKPMWIEISRYFKIHYIPEIMAKYRVLENSASHGDIRKLIAFLDSGADITSFYANYFAVPLKPKEKWLYYHETLMKYACRLSEKEYAFKFLKKALKNRCFSMKLLIWYLGANFSFVRKIIKKQFGM